MARLNIGRIWNDELVPISSRRMKLAQAESIMDNLRKSPHRKPDAQYDNGEFWIEVYNERHEAIIDPVKFSPEGFEKIYPLVMNEYVLLVLHRRIKHCNSTVEV